MSEFSIAMDCERHASSKFMVRNRQEINNVAYLRRMERLDARRNGARIGAVTSPPRHLDASLLEDGEALENAWAYEIATLIVKKRLRTPEAEAIADAARAACALVVARIENANAKTLEGMKVKARATLWTRNGEPLGREGAEDQAYEAA